MNLLRRAFQLQSRLAPIPNLDTLQLAQKLCVALLDVNQLEQAHPYALVVATGYEQLASSTVMEPIVGVYMFRLAKLCSYLYRDEEAYVYLQRALARLEITHGSSNSLVHEARNLLAHTSHSVLNR